MTFAELEGGFDSAHKEIKKKCFEDFRNLEDCRDIISKGLESTFTGKKGLASLLPIITTAVTLEAGSRFQTMEDFSLAVIKIFRSLDGSKSVIKSILASDRSYDELSDRPSFWKHYFVSRHRLKRKEIIQPPKEESSGIAKWLSQIFSCMSSRKETVPDKKTSDEKKGHHKVGKIIAATTLQYGHRIIL